MIDPDMFKDCQFTWLSLRYEQRGEEIMAGSQNPQGSGASRKISFNVSDQYDIQDVIGEGAYGVVWYVLGEVYTNYKALGSNGEQRCSAQTIWPESGHQEDHPIRPFHVLSPYATGNEVTTIFQS